MAPESKEASVPIPVANIAKVLRERLIAGDALAGIAASVPASMGNIARDPAQVTLWLESQEERELVKWGGG